MAQWIARRTSNPEVVGSSPTKVVFYKITSSKHPDTKLVFGQQVKIKFKMKAITLKSIFYSNIRYYNGFPSSDNNKMNKYNSRLP